MLIKKNGVSINLTESDLNRITNKVLSEGVKIKPKDGSTPSQGPSIEGLVDRIETLELKVEKLEGLQSRKM